jgi:enoyl-CoA hydratase/carnithine racemase
MEGQEQGPVTVARAGKVGWITVDHPPANALNREVLEGLRRALSELEQDPEMGAAVVTGAGEKFFVAGADIGEFVLDGPDATREKIGGGQRLTLEMESSRLPLGGGLELAMACDLRLAASTSRMGQPEILLGIIPGWGGTQRLPRLVGRGRALELLLTGEQIDAETALRIGLVNRVVEPERLRAEAQGLAEKLAGQAPLAVAAIKGAVAAGMDRPLATGLGEELGQFDRTFRTADAAEGIRAFLEKRRPAWTGE